MKLRDMRNDGKQESPVRDEAIAPSWTKIAVPRMKRLGITQDDLCQPLGVQTRGAVGHYFTGRRKLSDVQLVNLASSLRLSVGELLGEQPLYREIDDSELLELFHSASREAQNIIVAALRAANSSADP